MNNHCHYRTRKKERRRKIRGEMPFRKGYFDDGISFTEKRLIPFRMPNAFSCCANSSKCTSVPRHRHTLHAAIIAIFENGKANIVFGVRLKCTGARLKWLPTHTHRERDWNVVGAINADTPRAFTCHHRLDSKWSPAGWMHSSSSDLWAMGQ